VKNTGKFLKKAKQFQDFATKRAVDLIYARGYKRKLCVYSDSFDFYDNHIEIKIQEDTSHDCPDYEYITLTVDELELDEKEWNCYLESTKAHTIKRQEKQRIEKENSLLKKKMLIFEGLKKELGYEND
jgi:hypothetical protein